MAMVAALGVVPCTTLQSLSSCRIHGSTSCSASGACASSPLTVRIPSCVGLSVHGFREASGSGAQTVEQHSEFGRLQSAMSITRAAGERNEIQTTASDAGVKGKSIMCSNCTGNGAVVCSQCNGEGLNSVDHFNGRFKAGHTCWLCRGKKQMLCGECNGAGFLGGFLSTQDD